MVKVAEGMTEFELEVALMEVFAIPHGLLLDSLHDLTFDKEWTHLHVVSDVPNTVLPPLNFILGHGVKVLSLGLVAHFGLADRLLEAFDPDGALLLRASEENELALHRL